MPEQPLVSIIIPTFNRAHLIGETLDSVLAQTYQNWECIVVDDGSTDRTDLLMAEYVAMDSRFQYHHRPESHLPGGNGARNYGFIRSVGDYLIFLDSDDLLMTFTLEHRMTTVLDVYTDLLVSESGVFEKVVGDTGRVWNNISNGTTAIDFLIRFFNVDMPWQTAGVTWSRHFFEICGNWNEDLTAWQDWEMHCRALLYNPNLCVIPGPFDNYYRYLTTNGIAKSYKSINYLKATEKAILSVYGILIKNMVAYEDLKPYYKILIFCMLIKRPISYGHKRFPIKYLFKVPFFKGVSRIKFFNIYVIELLGSSSKIRTHILGSYYKKQQRYLKLQTSHLKY